MRKKVYRAEAVHLRVFFDIFTENKKKINDKKKLL